MESQVRWTCFAQDWIPLLSFPFHFVVLSGVRVGVGEAEEEEGDGHVRDEEDRRGEGERWVDG